MKTQTGITPGRNSSAAAKLEHVAERFQAFYNDLEQEKQQRRLTEIAKYQQLQEALNKVERNLESEMRRRSESDKKLQAHFDNELRRTQERLTNEMNEWQENVKASVDGISRTLTDLQKTFRDEKNERASEIEDLSQSLNAKLEECTVSLEDERVSRLEREAHTLKRIGEDINRIQSRVEEESTQRDSDIIFLKNELQEIASRTTGETRFQSTVLEEMKVMRQSLKVETDARVNEDESIVNAINDYTKALQEGLRLFKPYPGSVLFEKSLWRKIKTSRKVHTKRIVADSSAVPGSVETSQQAFSFPSGNGVGAGIVSGTKSSGLRLQVRNVSKTFHSKRATIVGLHPLNLDIEPCSTVVFLGPSGSGKTTLLRLISGLETPTTGQIIFDGQDVTDVSVQDRNLGFLFQSYALFKHMTVYENIAFGLRIRKLDIDPEQRVAELLKLVELEGFEKRLPKELSGGQRQRIAFARALASSPRLLLLDEPFGALDVLVRTSLRESMKKLIQKLNLTTLIVTHDQEEAFDLADQVVVFNRGRIEQVGTPEEIKNNPRTPFVMDFVGDVESVPSKSLLSRRLGFVTEKPKVMFRPEDIFVSAEIPETKFCPATVADRYHLGYKIRYKIRFDDEEEIYIYASREEAETSKAFGVLSRVYVTIPLEKMIGFHPEEVEYSR